MVCEDCQWSLAGVVGCQKDAVACRTPALASCPFLSLPSRLSPCLLVAPVVSDGAPRCAIHHLLTSLATLVPMAFMLVGGMVQGATPMWFLTGWMAFRRNPGAL
ncbi:hypothetical protein ACQJBY_069747 [Aegilops geniculata]